MASVKEILQTSKKNVISSAYLIEDIMRYRYQNPATPLTSAANELRDILSYVYSRSNPRNRSTLPNTNRDLITRADKYPANMIVDLDIPGRYGTNSAYELDGGRIFTGIPKPTYSKVTSSAMGGVCRRRNISIVSNASGEGQHVEYITVSPDGVGTNTWTRVPAFDRFLQENPMYLPVKIINNDYYFAVLMALVNNGTIEYYVVLSPDLWDYSYPCKVCDQGVQIFDDLQNNTKSQFDYRIYIDKFGRIFCLNEHFTDNTEASAGLIRVYDRPFNSDVPRFFGLSYALSGFNRLTSASTDAELKGFIKDTETGILWFYDWINNIQYEVVSDSRTEGTDVFEVPAVVSGSVLCTQAAVQITDLGFAPDKVFIALRGPSGPIWMTDICLSRDTSENNTDLGFSYHAINAGAIESPVKTISTDIQSTKYGGYINKDGFVIHLANEYEGMVCDYIVIGRASGNDPYLS